MDVTGLDFRNARLAAGLTLEQAAELTHCSYRAVQQWERGERPVDVARYRLLLHLAGLERIPWDSIRTQGDLACAIPARALRKLGWRTSREDGGTKAGR
jgi:transcriptional regulator with XRE-family HTH domain